MEDEERMEPEEDGAGDVEAQLAAARTEIARLRDEASQAAQRAAEAHAAGKELREQLRAASDAGAEAAGESAERERAAAVRYRDLVVRSEPSLPAELIAGESIEAVERSLEAAREIVGRVRTHIEQHAQAARVPAGAPPRSGPDLSAMSPEQKIRYGLGQRRA